MQRLAFLGRRVGLLDDSLRFLANGAVQPAEFFVLGDRQATVAAEALIEATQREGQQGQRIACAGVVHHGLDQPIVELQPGQPRRTLDDLGEAAQRHRIHRDGPIAEMVRIFAVLQRRMILEVAEEVGAQGGDRHQPAVRRFQPGPQQPQKPRRRFGGGVAEQFFGLVDGQQHGGFGLSGGEREIASEVHQHLAVDRLLRRRPVELGSNRSPVARPPQRFERGGQRHGELVERLELRPKRWHRQPLRRLFAQPRDDARPRQRRLAAARGAEQQRERGASRPWRRSASRVSSVLRMSSPRPKKIAASAS